MLAFLARAWVPVGYMPDAIKLQHGALALTFCSASGEIRTLDVDVFGGGADARGGGAVSGDASDHAEHPLNTANSVVDCPFGVSTPQAVLAAWQAPVFLATAYDAVAPPAPRSAAVTTAAPGSPLGSRAPPAYRV